MENPLKLRRLNANYTQDQLASLAGVTHDNIIRNEQGLFNKPSPRVLTAITRIDPSNTDRVRILKEYTNWIAWRRRQEPVRSFVRRQISFPQAEKLNNHPFLLWRMAVYPSSRIEFCKILCLHPATLLKYETVKQRPMPSQIYNALIEAGTDKKFVEKLAKLGSEYFVLHRSRVSQQAVNSKTMGDN
jgi:transcriptional regulator with XRE-family HTH domain